MEESKFGIKTITLGDGTQKYVPVIKKEHTTIFKMFSSWERIILVDNKYYTDGLLIEEVDLSYDQCVEYIKGYKEQLKKIDDKKIVSEQITEFE